MSQAKNTAPMMGKDKKYYNAKGHIEVDHTNDRQMVAEGIRLPMVAPRYDFSKTELEQQALKRVKNQYNAAMRAYYGDSWRKRRSNKTPDGQFNMPTEVLPDGRFRVKHQPVKAAKKNYHHKM